MEPFACANLLFSGQVAEVPGNIWGHSEDRSRKQGLEEVIGLASWATSTASVSACWYGLHRLRDDKLRVRAHCILDDIGICTDFKTFYDIESLKETNLGKNCPWCWHENTCYCSANIFKLNLFLFSFSFQTVMIIRGCNFPRYCKAKGTWILSDRWYFPRASRATRS